MSISTKVVNNALLARREFSSKVRAVQPDTAEFIAERQQQLCPRSDISEPGHVHIADTIHVEKTEDGHQVVEGDDGHIYGPFLEHGTDKMAAKPHQRPAAMEGKRYQKQRYSELK